MKLVAINMKHVLYCEIACTIMKLMFICMNLAGKICNNIKIKIKITEMRRILQRLTLQFRPTNNKNQFPDVVKNEVIHALK